MPIKDYSTTAANNTLTPPNGAPEGMAAGLVNNTIRQVMADTRSWYESGGWCDLGHVPTFVSTTSFTIPTDVTAFYAVGRRIRMFGPIMGTLYGYIVSSAYSAPNTTVTVILDSGALTSNLSRVDLLFLDQNAIIGVQGIVGRNKIINGDLRIWQRGTSGTPALNTTAYTADRVFTYATGASPTVSRYLLGSSGNPTTCAYALYAVGTAGNTAFQIGQKIESLNCLDMIAGRVYTFSAWMFCTTAVTPTWQVYNANVTDNWGSNTLVSSGTFASVSANTWTRVTGSFTSTNGCLNGVQLTFDVGTLVSGKNIYITGIQLEQGSVATPFEHRLLAPELVLCQRYLEQGSARGTNYSAGAANYRAYAAPFAVKKRAIPTMSATNIVYGGAGANTLVIEYVDDTMHGSRVTTTSAGSFIVNYDWQASSEL